MTDMQWTEDQDEFLNELRAQGKTPGDIVSAFMETSNIRAWRRRSRNAIKQRLRLLWQADENRKKREALVVSERNIPEHPFSPIPSLEEMQPGLLDELRNLAKNSPLFPGDTVSIVTVAECVRRGWAKQQRDGDYRITLAGIRALETISPADVPLPGPPRPPPEEDAFAWMQVHAEELAVHAGKVVAIHPERGIIFSNPDFDAVYSYVVRHDLLSKALIYSVPLGATLPNNVVPLPLPSPEKQQTKKALKEGGWRKVKAPKPWRPKEGECLEGTYLGSRPAAGRDDQEYIRHLVADENGQVFYVCGVMSDSLFLAAQPSEGDKVLIIFQGMKDSSSGEHQYKDFELYVKA